MTFRPNLIVAAATLLLAACGSPDEAKGAAGGVIASLADNVVEEVRQEMETKNLPVGSGSGHDLPKAEVTPEGVLVIDGVAVAMDQKQRDVALAYREGRPVLDVAREATGLPEKELRALLDPGRLAKGGTHGRPGGGG